MGVKVERVWDVKEVWKMFVGIERSRYSCVDIISTYVSLKTVVTVEWNAAYLQAVQFIHISGNVNANNSRQT